MCHFLSVGFRVPLGILETCLSDKNGVDHAENGPTSHFLPTTKHTRAHTNSTTASQALVFLFCELTTSTTMGNFLSLCSLGFLGVLYATCPEADTFDAKREVRKVFRDGGYRDRWNYFP